MSEDSEDTKPKDDEATLTEAKERYKQAEDAWSDVRTACLDNLKFARLTDYQWPSDISRQRQLEGRPCLTINRLPAFIRQVVNDARQNKPTIRVRPVDSKSDPATADVFNGLIRHIESQSDADIAYDTAIDCSVTQGLGFFYIDIDYIADDSFDTDIFIRRIADPQSVLFDPNTETGDSSDWRYAFITEMMDREEFKTRWPDADPVDFDGADGKEGWATEDQVRVCAYWERVETPRNIVLLSNGEIADAEEFEKAKPLFDTNGITEVNRRTSKSYKVVHRILSGSEILEQTDWAGKYIPVVPVFGDEVNVEGKRHFQSLVTHAKDPQRMFNYWRTTATELVALAPKAPWIGEEQAFEVEGEAEKWATANTQSHAYLRYKNGTQAPIRQPFAGVPAGALQEALNASDDIKSTIGMFDASLGQKSNETSGRAIMARQREGDVSTFHFIDNLTRAIRCAGRILIDLIPAVYSDRQMARILGEDGQPSIVKLGKAGRQPPPPAAGAPQGPPGQVDPEQAAAQQQAAAIEKVFDLTVGRYDVEAKAGPSFTSRREEAASQMTELIRAYPQAAPLIGDLLAKNLDWPDADKVAERLQMAVKMQMEQTSGNSDPKAAQAQASAKAQADIVKNRENLQAQILMNRENLQAEQQMNREKIAAKAYADEQANQTDVVKAAVQHYGPMLNAPLLM